MLQTQQIGTGEMFMCIKYTMGLLKRNSTAPISIILHQYIANNFFRTK